MQATRRTCVALVGICLLVAACTASQSVHPGGGADGTRPPEAHQLPGWHEVALPEPPGGPTAGYTDSGSAITCRSATECIFASTYLDSHANQFSITVNTTNAGLSWTTNTRLPSALDGGIASIACDQKYCFIVAQNAATTNQALARSSDNAKTWTVVPYPPAWAKNSIDADMIACSSSRCLVYGTNSFAATTSTGAPPGGKGALAATTDDFRTWTNITIPGATAIDQLTCLWSGQCWAEDEVPGDDLDHLATTLDGGVTWTDLGPIGTDNPVGNSSALGFALDPDHQVGLACENAQTCFILDNSDDLVTTHDGGRTWSLAKGPSAGGTDALTCTLSSTCWIVSVDLRAAWAGQPPS